MNHDHAPAALIHPIKHSGEIPTPTQVAADALSELWFEWEWQRNKAVELVAAAIEADRGRTRAVVARMRQLLPAILRDLDRSLGGRG